MFKVGVTTEAWAKKSGIPCAYSESTTSTNHIAKNEKISASAIISVYVTDHQSAGRGRSDHTWQAPAGQTLLSSWVFEMNQNPQPVLSAAIGLAVYRAFQTTWPWLPWSLKAPNDLYIADKKVAGLLIENVQEGSQNRLVIGLGLNVFAHPDLATATSLHEALRTHTQSLTAKEWEEALDRLLLELSLAVSQTGAQLSEAQCLALQQALNQLPLLKEKYRQVLPDGSLVAGKTQTHWSDL